MENMEKKMENMEKKMENMEQNMADIKTGNMEEKLESVNNKVRGLKTALIQGFDQIKEVLVRMEEMKEENRREVRAKPSGDREKGNIIVAGGPGTDSVEMF